MHLPSLVTLLAGVVLAWLARIAWKIRKLRRDRRRVPVEMRKTVDPANARFLELGNVEREMARLGKDEHSGSQVMFGVRLRSRNRVDVDAVKEALGILQRRHPILECSLAYLDGELVLERDPNMRIPVHVRDRTDDETWRSVYHSEIDKSPLRLRESPHAVWIFENLLPLPPGEEEKEIWCTDFFLQLSHFCFDGSSLSPLLHNLLELTFDSALRAEALRAPPLTKPTQTTTYADSSFPETSEVCIQRTIELTHPWSWPLVLGWEFAALVGMFINRIYLFSHRYFEFPLADPSQRDEQLSAINRTACFEEILTPRETDAVLRAARAGNCSVTTLVTACYLQACAEELERTEEETQRSFGARPKPGSAYGMHLSVVASTRQLCRPIVEETDMSVYLATLVFLTQYRSNWTARGEASFTLDIARELKERLRLAGTRSILYQGRLLGWLLGGAPTTQCAPVLNVSSWSAKSPIKEIYGGGSVRVLDGLFIQNVAYNAWINISVYTVASMLHVSLLAPYPRYSLETLSRVSKSGGARVREMGAMVVDGNSSQGDGREGVRSKKRSD